jgi:16S rRNA C967 or C1407 C5-methylase (RsmB/RsmF family)
VLPGSLDLVLSANEQRALAEAVLARPLKAVRLRPDAAQGRAGTMPLPFATEPVPWFTGGRFCIDTHQPGRFLAHAAGDYFVQDAGSMLALALMDPQPGEWVADVCGAPGAKATALLEVVGPGGGFLLANEPVRGRLPPLAYNLARVGFSRWLLTATDPERFEPLWQERFHAVLVDAPCTGQALVGRGKQSQAAFTAAQVAHSAARQQRILAAAAALVQPGGRLVYSTCTFAPEENEQVITSFLAAAPDWQVEELPGLAAWRSPLEPGGYRLYPHRDRCAGSYAIRLRQPKTVAFLSNRSRSAINSSGSSPPPRFGVTKRSGRPGLSTSTLPLVARADWHARKRVKLPTAPGNTGCLLTPWQCDGRLSGSQQRFANSTTKLRGPTSRAMRFQQAVRAGVWHAGKVDRSAGSAETPAGSTTACRRRLG